MGKENCDPQIWLYNLSCGVSNLIEQEKQAGYSIKTVVISSFIFEKIKTISGHAPTHLCGYVLEVLPEIKFEEGVDSYIDDDGESYDQSDIDGYIGLRADPIC